MDPEWWVTPELLRLRDISHRLEVLIWHNTDDGHAGRNPPRPEGVTRAEQRSLAASNPDAVEYDVMSMDYWRDFYGLDEAGQRAS